jgi:hypothetical protein
MMTARTRIHEGLRRIGLAQPAPPPAPEPVSPGGTQALESGALADRRAELAQQFAALQWDLGGIVYEMAIRDALRPELIVTKAAELQEIDGQLAEAERLLRLDDAASAGACPSCGSLYARGAVFCWHCGYRLLDARVAVGHRNGNT